MLRAEEHRDVKFLAPMSQRFVQILTDRLLNPSGYYSYSYCYLRPRRIEARYLTIVISAVNFKVLEQLENMTPVGKCVEGKLCSVACFKNLEAVFGFVLQYVFIQKISLIEQA